jgi:hypothetical protein
MVCRRRLRPAFAESFFAPSRATHPDRHLARPHQLRIAVFDYPERFYNPAVPSGLAHLGPAKEEKITAAAPAAMSTKPGELRPRHRVSNVARREGGKA